MPFMSAIAQGGASGSNLDARCPSYEEGIPVDKTSTMAPHDTDRTRRLREVVGVFHDVDTLEAAIDELQSAGFDRARLSLIADAETVDEALGHHYATPSDVADDPRAPRVSYVTRDEVGLAEGALISGPLYIAALVAGGTAVAAGGPVGVALAAAAAGGGVGAALGMGLAKLVGNAHAKRLQEHLKRGGILLWVNIGNTAEEMRALEVLRRHGAGDVHMHELPARA